MPLLLQRPLTSALALAATFALTLAGWQPVSSSVAAAHLAGSAPTYAPTVHAPSAPIVLM